MTLDVNNFSFRRRVFLSVCSLADLVSAPVDPARFAAQRLDRIFGRSSPFQFSVRFWSGACWTNSVAEDDFRFVFRSEDAWSRVTRARDCNQLATAMISGDVSVNGSLTSATEALNYLRFYSSPFLFIRRNPPHFFPSDSGTVQMSDRRATGIRGETRQ